MRIGGIGSISSANSMQATQITASDLKDQKSRNLQDDITDVQREIQKLSSELDLSVNERAEEKKELQKEKSRLDTKLKLHQDELLKSQKREIKLAELQEDRKPAAEETSEDKKQVKETSSDASEEKSLPADDRRTLQPGTIITQNDDGTVILKEILNQTSDRDAEAQTRQTETAKEEDSSKKEPEDTDTAADTGLTGNEIHAMLSADSNMQQADRQGTLVNKTSDDIAVLKSEIKLDAYRGGDTGRKKAELEEMQEQRKREMAFQFSLLSEVNRAMQTAAESNDSAASTTQIDTERTFHVSGVNTTPEEQALQQGFQVSIV